MTSPRRLRADFGELGKVEMAIWQQEANDFAHALRAQYEYIDKITDPVAQQHYKVQLRDSTIAIANVVHKHGAMIDMDEWFQHSGYEGTHPTY